jgi:glycosyltransferase involved in cell wall biosynthesis
MRSTIELSVVLTTFERPRHLARSLLSLVLQRGVAGRFEVVVADDGSRDETLEVVRRAASSATFPIRWTTHVHDGFRVAKCRNAAVRASRGRYLLFSDGDCVFPRDHLQQHLRLQRPGVVWAGECYRLGRQASEQIDESAIASDSFRRLVDRAERRRLRRLWLKSRCYQLLRHRSKPKIAGCNFSLCRADFEAVNGFDEQYVGWGCEDDDLGMRLRWAGKRVVTVFGITQGYHLWHPLDPTNPVRWRCGANVGRFLRFDRPIRPQNGLHCDEHRDEHHDQTDECGGPVILPMPKLRRWAQAA